MAGYCTITLDTTPPQGISLKLNNGAKQTDKRDITLDLSTSDPSTSGYQMKVWGDTNVPTEDSALWEDYSNTKSLTLTEGDGQKYIYVKMMDELGNVSNEYSSKIRLNTSGYAFVEPKDFYGFNDVSNEVTVLMDDATKQMFEGELRELMGKAVTITGDICTGIGKDGDFPIGFVRHIGYESSSSDNLVLRVATHTTGTMEVSGDVKAGDYVVCDGTGRLRKSDTYSNAKVYYADDNFVYGYIL